MVSWRSGVSLSCQPVSWTAWWWRTQSGQQVVEVGAAAVFPPDDVVELAQLVAGVAAGDGAGGVEGAQGAALGSVGEAGGAAEVERAGGVDDDAVADDDAGDVAFVEAAAQHVEGELDGESPVDGRQAVGVGGGGVEDDDQLGWSGPARQAGAGPGRGGGRRRSSVPLPVRAGAAAVVPVPLRSRWCRCRCWCRWCWWRCGRRARPRLGPGGTLGVRPGRRARRRDLFGEQLLGGRQQPGVEPQPGLRVEPAVEAPHPLRIDPGAQPGGPPLPLEAGQHRRRPPGPAPRPSAPGAARPGTAPRPGGPPRPRCRPARRARRARPGAAPR